MRIPSAAKAPLIMRAFMYGLKPVPFNRPFISMSSKECLSAGDGEFFFKLLLLEQAGVVAIQCQQFFVAA